MSEVTPDRPVLLLIPGMFNTGAIWDPVRVHLGDGVQVLVADVLTQESITAMADDAWRLVDALAQQTPLIVAGFSMGGYVAIDLLSRHASQVRGVAFVDSSAQVETAESMQNREKTIAALERNFERAVSAVIPFSLHPDHHGPSDLIEAMRSMMHAVGAQTAIRQTRAIMGRADHRAMLAQLALPTLVVCGREDKVTPPAMSEDIAALVPGARLAWIEQAGHQTPLEQPAALARALADFIGRISRSHHPQETP